MKEKTYVGNEIMTMSRRVKVLSRTRYMYLVKIKFKARGKTTKGC